MAKRYSHAQRAAYWKKKYLELKRRLYTTPRRGTYRKGK